MKSKPVRAKKRMNETTKVLSERIFDAFDKSNLADISKTQYKRRLELLGEQGDDVWSVIRAYEVTIPALLQQYEGKHASLQLVSGVVLSAFKYVPELKEVSPDALAAWRVVNEEAKKPMNERVMSAQPTERQKLGYVPFAELVRKRDALPSGSDARLLLSMYSMVPAKRNDFHALTIYPSTPPEGTTGNYLILPARGHAKLMVQEFKTDRKYTGELEDLPDALVAEIRASLARRKPEHRKFLFVQARSGEAYSAISFSSWANALLKKTFRKNLNLTLMRHSQITAMSFDNMTGAEREVIAKSMGHSLETQFAYKYQFRD